jgi:hypothetical protein
VVARVDESGVPPGERDHDLVYSCTVIQSCPGCGASEVEVYEHDCFDHDDVFDRYRWYVLERAATGQLRVLLQACPAPLSADCGCAVHEALRTSCRALPSSGNLDARPARLEVTDGLPRICA